MPKPLSGSVLHKTALEDRELIAKMAQRYGDDEIARVLSKLERRTGKGIGGRSRGWLMCASDMRFPHPTKISWTPIS